MGRVRKKVRAGTATPEERAQLAEYDRTKSNRGRKVSSVPVQHADQKPAPGVATPSVAPGAASLTPSLSLDPAKKPAPAGETPATPSVEPAPSKPAAPAHCGDPNCVACAYPPDKRCPVNGTPIHQRMNPKAARRAAKTLLTLVDMGILARVPDLELMPIPKERVDELGEGLAEMSFRRAGFLSAFDDVLMVGGSIIEHGGARVGELKAYSAKKKRERLNVEAETEPERSGGDATTRGSEETRAVA